MAAKLNSRQGKCKKCMLYNQVDKLCSKCQQVKEETQFSPKQWEQGDGIRRCLACQRHRSLSNTWNCSVCEQSQPKINFSQWLSKRQDQNKANGTQRCNSCMKKWADKLGNNFKESILWGTFNGKTHAAVEDTAWSTLANGRNLRVKENCMTNLSTICTRYVVCATTCRFFNCWKSARKSGWSGSRAG